MSSRNIVKYYILFIVYLTELYIMFYCTKVFYCEVVKSYVQNLNIKSATLILYNLVMIFTLDKPKVFLKL